MSNTWKYFFYVPALIGVPVHELSHYIMAKILRRNVTKVVLFQFSSKGQLGFVEHKYNQSVISHIANLAIGCAPLLGGTTSIYCITLLLAPELSSNFDINRFLGSLQDQFFGSAVWAFICSSIALFMFPSKSDLRSCLPGAYYLALIVVAAFFAMDQRFDLLTDLEQLTAFALSPLAVVVTCNFALIFFVTFLLAAKKILRFFCTSK